MRNIILFLAMMAAGTVYAEQADTAKVAQTMEKHDRNVMLDASATVKPRDIPIGLPAEAGGTMIMEDGMPVSAMPGPILPYSHWVGGSSYGSMDLKGIEETLLRTEVLGFSVDSYTALGTDTLHGTMAAKTNNDGLINFDLNVNGPLGKGWYFTTGAYGYFDPTSVHPKHTTFVNRTRIYKAGVTRRWGQSEASLLYKLTVASEGLSGSNRGPFIYNGDGSVSPLNGFRLGRDSYMPVDVSFDYMDLLTGQITPVSYNDQNKFTVHDLNFRMVNRLSPRWSLDTRLHVTGTKNMLSAGIMEAGIDNIENGRDAQGRAVTTADGKSYSGLMQRRVMLNSKYDVFETMVQSELVRKSQGHTTNIGLSYWFFYEQLLGTDVNIAQTVQDDPQRLLLNGQRQWGYNLIAQFGRGRDHYISLFAIDDWQVTPKLSLYYGLRTDLFCSNYDVAVDNDGQTNNQRHDKFTLNDGTATVTGLNRTKLNLIGVARASYQLVPNLFLKGEYLYSRLQRRMEEYTFDTMPTDLPYVKHFMRGGVNYVTSWINASLMVGYVTCQNISATEIFTKQVKGVSETQGKNINYNIGTLNVTADANATFGNFSMHVMATYQEPRYRDYNVALTFSDASKMTLDYSDKFVTGMSKVMLELDPSYQLGYWRLWLSARYYSRQYASLANNVYFNGHWETFAGVDWQATQRLALALSVTNLLNQSGASGTIRDANTITDINKLVGYKTAGSFIRPFTVSLTASYKF